MTSPCHVVHATAVALGPHAALLRGPSGSGKSDLALRFLATKLPIALCGREMAGPGLVADDRVLLERCGPTILARCHERLAGLLEVRGLGIVDVAAHPPSRLVLLVDLVAARAIERLPEAGVCEDVLGVALPVVRLAPFEASAPLKLALALLHASASPAGAADAHLPPANNPTGENNRLS
jgi:HPr kinase/phosphorylase